MAEFLPISKEDVRSRKIETLDFVLVTGDAYVDHPSFGTAIIGRVLEDAGYSVGVIAQPDWTNTADFCRLGRPNLAFLVNAGNIDSMVAHYTVAKKKRNEDSYSPGGVAGKRPDRAVIVYCNRIREAYGDVPIIIGGLEPSLRRFAHYDYWSDQVRHSMLADSSADILTYGMGERQTVQIANLLGKGVPIHSIDKIAGTCVLRNEPPKDETAVYCPSFEMVKKDKKEYAKACKIQFDEHDPIHGHTIVQPHGKKYLICFPPAMPLGEKELDKVYSLPYCRMYHPVYEKEGGVPAITEVEFSITSCRGCFGGCHFCSLAFHQGKMVSARSHESILKEAMRFTENKNFKGYISDVGGPTANFRRPSCEKQKKYGMCKDRSCLTPTPCKNLVADHRDYVDLLRKLRKLPGIKRVFVRSGVRYDYVQADKDGTFFKELCQHHISGQLKVAPEHVSENTLRHMNKPSFSVYRAFYNRYVEYNKSMGKKQYLVPYLMSSHPGCTMKDAIDLACYLKETGYHPQQVQDFYPTPGTISTCMYYTGINPLNGKEVYVPRASKEKAMQRALMQYEQPRNRDLVVQALKGAGREDLIGYGKYCLIPPDRGARRQSASSYTMPDRGQQKGGRAGSGAREKQKNGRRTEKRKK